MAARGTGTAQLELITATFPDRASAERAFDALTRRGYTRDDVNVLMSDETRKRHFGDTKDGRDTELGNKAAEGGLTGAAIGGTAGAIFGAMVAAGTLALPGIGLVVAGPLAAGLAGLGAGGAAGGIVGALIGAGIPEERARRYESDVKSGGIVMGVRPHSPRDAEEIARDWQNYRGVNIYR